ncbi:hypothetical protein JWJ90_23085, partial [Desulfobulbus rhabdoformis]|uniref:hypothetical protein n=1 Tax=Desulfobulbus rhabdoformis TaxID=34032 RepID=UPI001963CDDE
YSLHSLTVPDIENACQQAGLCFQQCDANGGILYFQAYKGRQSQGKRTKFLASKHTAKKPIIAGCSELFLLDTHFGFLSLQQIT